MTSDKKEVMLSPPDEVHLSLNLPQEIQSLEDLHKYLWERFHIDLEIDPESENYEDLFYNSDLRSFMGFMLDFGELVVFPRYYIGETKASVWSKRWRQLVRQSDIEETE